MPGPKKPYYQAKVGQAIQTNYKFLADLWEGKPRGTPGQPLRDYLFTRPTEAAIRTALAAEGIEVPGPIRIMLVDIEHARTKVYGDPIKPTEDWYLLILPPVPRREPEEIYKEMQAWRGAYYHASNDGYGM